MIGTTVNLLKRTLARCPRSICLACFALSILSAGQCMAATEIVYEQPSRTSFSGSIAIASTQSDDPLEPRAKTFDNFTLTSAATIDELTWRGSFNNVFNPNPDFRSDIDFHIWIYGNSAGNVPNVNDVIFSTILDAGTTGNDDGTQVSTSVVPGVTQSSGGAIVDYHATIPTLELSAGTYWLSIVGDQVFASPHPDDAPGDPNSHLDPTWAWVTANSGDNLAYQFDARFDPFEPGYRLQGTCPGRCDTTFSLLTTIDDSGSGITGDFNDDGLLTDLDIDLLTSEIRNPTGNNEFDLTNDGSVNSGDLDFWVGDIFGTLAGDANLDRVVDFGDFLLLADRFGDFNGWANGDFDGDGKTLFADFVLLAGNFGLNSSAQGEPPFQESAVVAASVPEPSSQLYVLFVLFVLIVWKRTKMWN